MNFQRLRDNVPLLLLVNPLHKRAFSLFTQNAKFGELLNHYQSSIK